MKKHEWQIFESYLVLDLAERADPVEFSKIVIATCCFCVITSHYL